MATIHTKYTTSTKTPAPYTRKRLSQDVYAVINAEGTEIGRIYRQDQEIGGDERIVSLWYAPGVYLPEWVIGKPGVLRGFTHSTQAASALFAVWEKEHARCTTN